MSDRCWFVLEKQHRKMSQERVRPRMGFQRWRGSQDSPGAHKAGPAPNPAPQVSPEPLCGGWGGSPGLRLQGRDVLSQGRMGASEALRGRWGRRPQGLGTEGRQNAAFRYPQFFLSSPPLPPPCLPPSSSVCLSSLLLLSSFSLPLPSSSSAPLFLSSPSFLSCCLFSTR